MFAGDQKDVNAIYANPLLAHLPSVKNKRVWALGTENVPHGLLQRDAGVR